MTLSYDAAMDAAHDAALLELLADGVEVYGEGLALAADNLIPNLPMDIVAWAEGEGDVPGAILVPPGVSSRSGPLVLTPLQRAIVRSWQEAGVKRVVFLKPPRFGSTFINVIGLLYYACHLGIDVIFYERSEGDAQDFADKKLTPILLESTALAGLVRPDTRSGIQDAWMDRYLRNGASIQIRGVSTNGVFRGIKGGFIAMDEVGAPEFKGGDEGSKPELAWRRAQEFFDPVMYLGGTPTTVGSCTVSEQYELTDKRVFRFDAPCCGARIEFLPLVSPAGSVDEVGGPGLKYRCEAVEGTNTPRIVEVGYECECGSWIPETAKVGLLESGRFEATTTAREEGYVGFYAWAIHSTDPQSTWRDIAAKDMSRRLDPSQEIDFQNLVLALPHQPGAAGGVEPTALEARAEPYAAAVPAGVRRIVVGVDAQEGSERLGRPPRLEAVAVGYGAGEESWVLERMVLATRDELDPETGKVVQVPCEPFTPASNRAFWAWLDRGWTDAEGRRLTADAVAVDVGWRMNEALAFVHHPESKARKLYAVRGRSEVKGSRSPVLPPGLKASQHKASRLSFYAVGTASAKDTLFRRLQVPPGPERVHFPRSLSGTDFYEQLSNERLVRDPKNPARTWYDKASREASTEVVDCLVYAWVALSILKRRDRATRDAVAVPLNWVRDAADAYAGDDRSAQAVPVPERDSAPPPPAPRARRRASPVSREPAPPPPSGAPADVPTRDLGRLARPVRPARRNRLLSF